MIVTDQTSLISDLFSEGSSYPVCADERIDNGSPFMSPEQGYWTNFSSSGIGITQQVLSSRDSSSCLGSRAGRFRDDCASNRHHHD